MVQFKIHHFKSLTSTQDKAKEFAKKEISSIVIISDTQTRGRGRMQREWYSQKGNLFMSIIVKPNDTENLQHLTFAAAICIAKSINKIAKISCSIKWPNDVNYNRKKLCGILTEGIFGAQNFAIVGIGLNVNQKKFGKILPNAASLSIITGKDFSTKIISKTILAYFERYIKKYNSGKFSEIRNEWEKYSDTIGKEITVKTLKKDIKGTAIGINEDCSLKIKTKKGTVDVYEGDVSVRY